MQRWIPLFLDGAEESIEIHMDYFAHRIRSAVRLVSTG